ncbi:DNA-directed RNA polymerase sigma-70 factor [Bacteroidales bacterium]|nr:DNA-directed RNA polymerase sigma-70 factor [Bacteroidales bacterium]
MTVDLENECLKKLILGDHKSFDRLFMHYHPRLKNFLFGFIKNEEEACDMAQEIFFKIWQNRESLAQVNSFRAYLFRMARNMVYDYYQYNLVKESYQTKHKQASPDTEDLIEQEIYAKELSILIDMEVEQMPKKRQRIFKMSRQAGLSNDEISQQLQISKRTVENHITQALADLRKVLLCFVQLFL